MSEDVPNSGPVRDIWISRLASGKSGLLTVRSGSMRPLLNVGEKIRDVPCHRLIFPGDLAVYQQKEKLVCHRLIFPYAPGRFYARGDLSPRGEKVRDSEILGRPDLILTSTESFDLHGMRFRFWNGVMLLTVVMKAIWQLLKKFFRVPSSSGDGFFIYLLRFSVGKIRVTGK